MRGEVGITGYQPNRPAWYKKKLFFFGMVILNFHGKNGFVFINGKKLSI